MRAPRHRNRAGQWLSSLSATRVALCIAWLCLLIELSATVVADEPLFRADASLAAPVAGRIESPAFSGLASPANANGDTVQTQVESTPPPQNLLDPFRSLPQPEESEKKKDPSVPDIEEPGPDMGDFPNSAYTLPKGRAYLESAPLTYSSADKFNSASYAFPFLLRYGVTDDVEFRIFASGLTSVFSNTSGTTTGLTPLVIDTKIHLWDDQIQKFIPAASLEVYIQSTWGSNEFDGGVQPALNLNLDFPVTKKTTVEMTFTYAGVQDAVNIATGERFIPRFHHLEPILHRTNLNIYEFSYQWAIEQKVTEKFTVFLNGYYNGTVYQQNGTGTAIGVGYFYTFNKRLMMFNSYTTGLTPDAAPFMTQLGTAFAF